MSFLNYYLYVSFQLSCKQPLLPGRMCLAAAAAYKCSPAEGLRWHVLLPRVAAHKKKREQYNAQYDFYSKFYTVSSLWEATCLLLNRVCYNKSWMVLRYPLCLFWNTEWEISSGCRMVMNKTCAIQTILLNFQAVSHVCKFTSEFCFAFFKSLLKSYFSLGSYFQVVLSKTNDLWNWIDQNCAYTRESNLQLRLATKSPSNIKINSCMVANFIFKVLSFTPSDLEHSQQWHIPHADAVIGKVSSAESCHVVVKSIAALSK